MDELPPPSMREPEKKDDLNYGGWAVITGVISFVIIWLYALSEWGLLIGLVLGWLPALIGGFILGILWPLVAIGVFLLILLVITSIR